MQQHIDRKKQADMTQPFALIETLSEKTGLVSEELVKKKY